MKRTRGKLWKNLPTGAKQNRLRWEQENYYERWAKTFPPRLRDALLLRHIKERQLDGLLDDLDAGEGYFIFGPPGSGKTYLAAALLIQIRKRVFLKHHKLGLDEIEQTEFVKVPDFYKQLKAGFKDDSNFALLEKLRQVDWLFLDDFGLVKSSAWSYMEMYDLVDYRYNHLKPTIYTSNFTLQELEAQYEDGRLVSRIQHASILKKLTAKNWRKS
jgi:DNA replication protein DnaC